MNHWLIKTEPATYSWSDLERDQKTHWDGVRNFQARGYLRAMAVGDLALFYHSGDVKAVIGIVGISKAAFPDPSDPAWVAVEIVLREKLEKPVSLKSVKANPLLAEIALVKSSRLSVQPIHPDAFNQILLMSRH